MAGKTLPAPLALVIQGRRGRVWIGMGSLMLLQIAHRGKEFPAQSTTVLPLEGHGGRNPSCTTRICARVEGARWDKCEFADASADSSQRLSTSHTEHNCLTLRRLWRALVIQGWRERVGIHVRSQMFPQVAHRGKIFSAQSTTVIPLEGHDGRNPSRTTRTCDPGVEGAH
jgi:hypothetical protein